MFFNPFGRYEKLRFRDIKTLLILENHEWESQDLKRSGSLWCE